MRGSKGKTQPTTFGAWTPANMMCVERLVNFHGVPRNMEAWSLSRNLRDEKQFTKQRMGAGFTGGQRTWTKAEARKGLSMEGWGQSGALRGVMGSWGLEERGNVCRVRGPGDEVGRGC